MNSMSGIIKKAGYAAGLKNGYSRNYFTITQRFKKLPGVSITIL